VNKRTTIILADAALTSASVGLVRNESARYPVEVTGGLVAGRGFEPLTFRL